MGKQTLFDVNVQIVHQTDKSCGEIEPDVGGTHKLTAPEWILKDKGLL